MVLSPTSSTAGCSTRPSARVAGPPTPAPGYHRCRWRLRGRGCVCRRYCCGDNGRRLGLCGCYHGQAGHCVQRDTQAAAGPAAPPRYTLTHRPLEPVHAPGRRAVAPSLRLSTDAVPSGGAQNLYRAPSTNSRPVTWFTTTLLRWLLMNWSLARLVKFTPSSVTSRLGVIL
jgi:hypothetical protein